MNPTYSIQQLSKEFAVTSRTLRFYEEKGLLAPTRMGQNRVYSAKDRAHLILILRGKTLGLTLEQSADLIGMYNPASNNKKQLELLIQKIQDRKQQLKAQREALDIMIADLEAWEDRSRTAMSEKTAMSGKQP